MAEMSECKHCGKPYEKKRKKQRYCSRACGARARSRRGRDHGRYRHGLYARHWTDSEKRRVYQELAKGGTTGIQAAHEAYALAYARLDDALERETEPIPDELPMEMRAHLEIARSKAAQHSAQEFRQAARLVTEAESVMSEEAEENPEIRVTVEHSYQDAPGPVEVAESG